MSTTVASTTVCDERWLIRSSHHEQPAFRLYCFHHAGGTASEFARWHRYLPEAVEVCAVQLPGRGARVRERPHIRMRPLIDEVLARLEVDLPFAFFGHSFGALVAFELAVALGAADAPWPQHLFLSARPAPGLVVAEQTIHDLPDKEFLEVVHRRHGGVSDELRDHHELRELVLPYFRADYEVTETYRAAEPPSRVEVPITVLGGTDDEISVEQLEAWQRHAGGPFEVRLFPGDHFYLRPYRTDVLDLVRTVTG